MKNSVSPLPAAMLGLALLLFASCVPQRKFTEMEDRYKAEFQKNAECTDQLTGLQQQMNELNRQLTDLRDAREGLMKDTMELGKDLRRALSRANDLNLSASDLKDKLTAEEKRSLMRREELMEQIKQTQSELKDKTTALDEREKQLKALQASLQSREARVAELEKVIAEKDANLSALKKSISDALTSFQGKGITVNVKDGKVYVSLDEKLLFESGKYTVNADGKAALLQISQALKNEPDVQMLVEGHTDNVPYRAAAGSVIKDNLDLSVLRATEVTRILVKDGGFPAGRVTAAGRGDALPIADNSTPDGRAKNRRTEVILTPKLNDLLKAIDK